MARLTHVQRGGIYTGLLSVVIALVILIGTSGNPVERWLLIWLAVVPSAGYWAYVWAFRHGQTRP